jgi:leader peptidase (prepilin peptidase)/N-methyltransferase
MREIVWAVVGWAFGIGAARRARSVIAKAQADGSAWFYGSLHHSSAWVQSAAFLGGAAAWAMAHTFSGNVATFAFVVFTTNLLQQMLVDLDTHLLPRGRSRGATIFGLILLGLTSMVQVAPARWWWGILGSFVAWLVFRLLQVISRGDLGGGDVSLAVLIGLHLGWIAIGNVLIFTLVTFVLGGLAGIVALIGRKGRRHHLAFGPWMVLAAVLTITFEEQIRLLVVG